jgi:hypothetical protein
MYGAYFSWASVRALFVRAGPTLTNAPQSGLFSVLDLCSAFEHQLLHSALPPGGRALLKGMRMRYEQQHKYSGKV